MPAANAAQRANHYGGARRLVIWRFSDGKAGHDNQSLGLAEALAGLVETETHTLAPIGFFAAFDSLVAGRLSAYSSYPDPDLLVGAGHGTHLSMLAARRTRGGRAVVLMTPTLPKSLFDLCLIPEHDRSRSNPRVITTRGALNRVRPLPDKDPARGLILLGGPSRHFLWNDDEVIAQLETISRADADARWTIATSRRTPPGLTAKLRGMGCDNLSIKPVEETAAGWLSQALGRAARVWVSEDSASMVYEALSSGAAVGLIVLEGRRPGRLASGLEKLIEEKQLVRFSEWASGAELPSTNAPLDESGRCAKLILERWPHLVRARQ